MPDELDYAGTDELPADRIHSFIELHIEQGPLLLEEEAVIGVVDRVQGILWHEIVLKGNPIMQALLLCIVEKTQDM